MTKNRDFKTLVRQRMAKTGERYSTARAHVLAAGGGRGPAAVPGLLPGIVAIGGAQPDLAATRNLCVNAGLTGPNGGPISEALAFGLAGGIGFLYGVFEYGDIPTMTIVARNQSMPDPFCQTLFDRVGIATAVTETTGAKKAAAALDQVLAEEHPALCTVASGGLPYFGLPPEPASMAPHIVGVIGRDSDPGGKDESDGATGERLLLDDRSPEPIAVDRADFDAARAGYRAVKHRMVVIESVPADLDWSTVLKAAVAGAVEGFDRPPVPQFKANVGLAGLEKWSTLLAGSGKKSWRSVFGSEQRAAIGLSRLYDCINHAYTAPDGGRPLFADFLDEAATVVDEPAWREAAELWRASGQRWRELSSVVVDAHPNVERYAELSDERAGMIDMVATESAAGVAATMRSLYDEQQELVESCDLTADAAAAVYDSLAGVVTTIVETEARALTALA